MVFHIHSHVVMLRCVAWGFIVPSFKGEDRRRFATICDDHAGDMAAYLIFWGKTWIILRIFSWRTSLIHLDELYRPRCDVTGMMIRIRRIILNEHYFSSFQVSELLYFKPEYWVYLTDNQLDWWYLVNYWKMSLLRIYPTNIGVHSQIYRTIRTEWSAILVHFHGKLRT